MYNIYKKIINYFKREKHLCVNCKYQKKFLDINVCTYESRIHIDYIAEVKQFSLCEWYNKRGRCKKFSEK